MAAAEQTPASPESPVPSGVATSPLLERIRRGVIGDAVGGTADDLVIFCGSGATAAVNKLIGILELRIPAGLDERYSLAGRIPEAERPAVFVGPYEHHSNELPWRESIAEVVVIGEDADGHIDLAGLSRQPARYARRPLLIGSFSAASNVTGILTDTGAVAALLHAHGALSFWDYAAAGPYVPIRVSESRPGPGITRTRCSCPRTSSPAARRPPASWWCAATWSATRCRPPRAAGP